MHFFTENRKRDLIFKTKQRDTMSKARWEPVAGRSVHFPLIKSKPNAQGTSKVRKDLVTEKFGLQHSTHIKCLETRTRILAVVSH